MKVAIPVETPKAPLKRKRRNSIGREKLDQPREIKRPVVIDRGDVLGSNQIDQLQHPLVDHVVHPAEPDAPAAVPADELLAQDLVLLPVRLAEQRVLPRRRAEAQVQRPAAPRRAGAADLADRARVAGGHHVRAEDHDRAVLGVQPRELVDVRARVDLLDQPKVAPARPERAGDVAEFVKGPQLDPCHVYRDGAQCHECEAEECHGARRADQTPGCEKTIALAQEDFDTAGGS